MHPLVVIDQLLDARFAGATLSEVVEKIHASGGGAARAQRGGTHADVERRGRRRQEAEEQREVHTIFRVGFVSGYTQELVPHQKAFPTVTHTQSQRSMNVLTLQ